MLIKLIMSQKISRNNLFKNVKEVLEAARKNVYRAVNFSMVVAYWEIGKLLVEDEQKGNKRASYGSRQLEILSVKLTREFGRGYSVQSLWNMRQFFIAFPKLSTLWRESSGKKTMVNQKLSTVWRELTWSHYKLLMRVENNAARLYYAQESVEQNWSVRALERQINSFYYERILSSKNKKAVKGEAVKKTASILQTPADFIKDPFVLEFMGIKPGEKFLEKDLEQGLIDNLQNFLLEFGKGFAFVSRQQRISTDQEDFFIDLVFYNYLLKCFVLIDLKIGKLTHQDVGQMDMYVRMFEEQMKTENDNPTIGIILCSQKNETVAKYSVLKENRRMFASKYLLHLPSEKELANELKREVKQLQNIKYLHK